MIICQNNMELTDKASDGEEISPTLTEEAKSNLIRQIMLDSSRAPQQKQQMIRNISSGREAEDNGEAVVANTDCDYECQHYEKRCSKFYYSCCETRDQCHRCHKEHRSCKAPRVTEVICDNCCSAQEPSSSCIQCQSEFSRSFCPICNIWTAKEIFHCNSCGLCRVGKSEDHFHCDTCNACYALSSRGSHQCVYRPMDEIDCPICGEDIHSSQATSVRLPCAHVVHTLCMNRALRSSAYRCPFCRRSMVDMSEAWAEIKASIEHQLMPEEIVVQYVCYDCGHKDEELFHYLGIECSNCHSFNTAR